MKKVKYINILLLVMFSFSILHSFVLEESEHYHHSIEKNMLDKNTDILKSELKESHTLHCEFHHSYILTQNFTFSSNISVSTPPLFKPNFYAYCKMDNFLKPPIA